LPTQLAKLKSTFTLTVSAFSTLGNWSVALAIGWTKAC
jgi:hypothetical protein